MMISSLLEVRTIELDFAKRRRQHIVERLVELVAGVHPLEDQGRLVREILQRDSEVSTAIGDGVAIPHKLTPLVSQPQVAFLQTRKGGHFSSPDGIPVRLFFLLLAPEGSVNEHLRTLSKLARLLHDARFREELLEATVPQAVVEMIRSREG
ncbi:PTS system, fructose-specific IIC component [Alkalispirochaeta americana]|uniref:PTS system, fructose-specific IIC component n=1 Tax=Alkalispirochaeta americana TaxID=159291 RepID=A0A1N6T6J8_9SPIO|nr:PTS sugar transporter subunit IIA [Alkalispirochaeta americana]SIQ48949.1 PTS system, fructose-specific IIC component [Alkalispirochaeta americana]